MDINKNTSNPAAVAAMDAFIKEQTPRHELDMIGTLMRARFMSPVIFSAPVVDGQVPKDTQIQQYVINNPQGDRFFLAFTDEEAFKKWAKEEQRDFVLLNLAECLALIQHAKDENIKGLVVNPFSHNVTLTTEMLVNLPKRFEALRKSVPPRFLLGRPKTEPVELEEALQKFFKKKQKEVQEAWLLMALREGTKKPRYMLVVDYEGEPEDAKTMFPAIAEEAKPYLKEGDGLDIVRRNQKFAEDVLQKTEPFYQKKAGLLW